ncbi:MAG TPA: decaprenyl-phosphate phosphoribosyltransferase [Solirubrobacteraceae bacterium]|nr:decaprenyl-phosphate phosphoribosyltransferase [Solirubrobacteraceae bacterium]
MHPDEPGSVSLPVRAMPSASLAGRRRCAALIRLARPRQWIKNLLVVAAPGAAGALGHDDVPLRLAVACLAFCLLSAGVYALNDVRDRGEDRRHPQKRRRPVAAGELTPGEAVWFGACALACGLLLCFAVSAMLALVGAAYLAVTVSYSWLWRRLPMLDLAALAAGFVLRAVAGGVAAPVSLSRWFLAVITCAAVFVAAGKRFAELRSATEAGRRPRLVLSRYGPRSLAGVLALAGAGALFAYFMWALQVPLEHGGLWRLATVPPFAVCLARYALLVRSGEGEAPEEAILTDRLMIVGALAWLILFALAVHAAG